MALTPQDTLGLWLLRVLDANNGRASKWLALRLMEEAYGHLLTEEDRELRPSVSESKWENNTAWERNALVKEGLLQPRDQSGHGVWAITDAGRRVVERGSNLATRRNIEPQPHRSPPRETLLPSEPEDQVAIHVDYQDHRTRAWFTPTTHRVDIAEGPLAGQTFKSPSGAARAVVAKLNPGVDPARNGWSFWFVSQTGDTLQSIRRK